MLTESVIPGSFLYDFRRRMDRLFSDFTPDSVPAWPLSSLGGTLPAVNIWENNDAWTVEMATPGVKENQIALSMVGNDLNVQINRPTVEDTSETAKYWRQERLSESQSFSIKIPGTVNDSDITAELENGILLIRLPKNEENKVRKIEVSAKP